VGKTEHHVKNLRHLAETLEEVTLEDDEILNSHDVVSLFTNRPIKKDYKLTLHGSPRQALRLRM